MTRRLSYASVATLLIIFCTDIHVASSQQYSGGTGRTPDFSPVGWKYRPARRNVYNRLVTTGIFQFIYESTADTVLPSPSVRDAIDLAGSILSKNFDWPFSPPATTLQPIFVSVSLVTNGSSGILVQANPNGYFLDSSDGIRYPRALCELRENCTPPVEEIDIYMVVNLDRDFFVSSAAGVPQPNQYDLTSVVLYYLLAGLGVETRASSSGYLEASITAYDNYVQRTDTSQRMSAVISNPTNLATFIQSGVLEFDCPGCLTVDCSTCDVNPVLFSPATFDAEHSVTNLNDATYQNSNNQLYVSTVPQGRVVHEIGPLIWKMLGTMGYPMRESPLAFSTCEECVANYYQWCDVDFLFCEDQSLGPFTALDCPGGAFALTLSECGSSTLSTTGATSTSTTTGNATESSDDERLADGLTNEELFGIAIAAVGAVAICCLVCVLVYLVVCMGSVVLGSGGRFLMNSTAEDERRVKLDWADEL